MLLHFFLQAFALASMLGCLIAPGVGIDFLLRRTWRADVFYLTFKSYSGSLRFASTLGGKGKNTKAKWEEENSEKNNGKNKFLF